MAVNTAFHTNNLHSLATERSLYQNLVKEAIQIYGHDVYYVNRDTIALDNVLGEDTLSKFTKQTILGIRYNKLLFTYTGVYTYISKHILCS